MGRSVRIPVFSAEIAPLRRLLDVQTHEPGLEQFRRRLEALLVRVPKSRPPRQVERFDVTAEGIGGGVRVAFARSRKPSKEEKRKRRASIREVVFRRAEVDGAPICEGPAGSNPRLCGRCINPATDLQHVFGRGKGRMPESERNCLAACRTCHEAEGRNIPNSAAWWTWFGQWLQDRDFTEEARRARSRARFDEVRATSTAAPRTR